MTTPITKPKKSKQVPAPAVKKRDWCCGTPVTGPHVDGCPSAPSADHAEPATVASESAPEPPPTPPVEVLAAAQPRSYGFTKIEEADLELPSGSLVRYRKLTKSHLLKLNLIEVLDGFTPELLADIRSGEADESSEALAKALIDPKTNGKIFGPVDRVVAAAVIKPTVVLVGPTTEHQVNVDDVDLEDKIVIFGAAIGEQLDALKSVRDESPSLA